MVDTEGGLYMLTLSLLAMATGIGLTGHLPFGLGD